MPLPAADQYDYTPHLLAATYYSLKDNLQATLMLNNKGPHPLRVRVTIFGSGGERLDVPTATVEGNSFRELDLRDYAGSNPAFADGSIQVFYHGHNLMLGAQVYLTDVRHSLVFEEKLLEIPDSFASSRLEGVWWMPSHKCEARLVLSNTSDSPLSVSVVVDGSAPRRHEPVTLTLSPHQTSALDILRDLVGARDSTLLEVGGISLTHSGQPGALMARMLIQGEAEGYSSWVRFYDPRKGGSTNLQGAGLRLGSVAGEKLTPVVFARNVGSAETTVTARIPYTDRAGQTEVVALPELRLAPGEAKTFNLTPALAESQLEQKAATAGLEFKYAGEPGSVLISAQSVSESHNLVFQVPIWDILTQQSSTGGYPWKTDDDTSTVVYIKNTTNRRQQYTWELRFDGGGDYSLGLKTIEPHQTVAIDTRALRDEQTPDVHGHTIPLNATRGQIHWSVRGSENLALIGRAEQYDTARGLATSYACQNCCPDSFFNAFSTDCPTPMLPADTSQFTAFQQDTSCYGGVGSPYPVTAMASWSSYTPDIAAIDMGGVAEGVSAGDGSISAGWEAATWEYGGPHYGCIYSPIQAFVNSLCTIVDVRSITPGVVNVSTGDDPSAHPLAVNFFPPDYSTFMLFHQEFKSNVGGTSRASIDVPSSFGFTPIQTTVKASPAGNSAVFTVQPEISGRVFPQQSRIVVPPQILLQMMRNEARGLSSPSVRLLLGWSLRNRFDDAQFFSGQITYQAAISAGATHDGSVTTGEQPELDDAASVFDGFIDISDGCQGFWSPTPAQWLTVRAAIGGDTLPSNVGAPGFISSYPRQYVYFPQCWG